MGPPEKGIQLTDLQGGIYTLLAVQNAGQSRLFYHKCIFAFVTGTS